jgi:hypothetical protein
MALYTTHVPTPAALGARRGSFSFGRRVASSRPVASSASSSSFHCGSNGRTLALRTRAAAKNGGRDTARPRIADERNAFRHLICP